MTHLGDITKIDWFHVPPVDVVTGGGEAEYGQGRLLVLPEEVTQNA